MTPIRLCQNCQYAIPDPVFKINWWWIIFPILGWIVIFSDWRWRHKQWQYAKCLHTAKIELVTGSAEYHYCVIERNPLLNNKSRCGPEAKFFKVRR